jgi:RNA recognition motif-containing protein
LCGLVLIHPVILDLVLKKSLRTIFGQYGDILDIVAHSNIRMRGQAFVIFEDTEASTKAMAEVQGFPLYGKPLVWAEAEPAT